MNSEMLLERSSLVGERVCLVRRWRDIGRGRSGCKARSIACAIDFRSQPYRKALGDLRDLGGYAMRNPYWLLRPSALCRTPILMVEATQHRNRHDGPVGRWVRRGTVGNLLSDALPYPTPTSTQATDPLTATLTAKPMDARGQDGRTSTTNRALADAVL